MATTIEHEQTPASKIGSAERLARKDLRETIENHALWLESLGETGSRADLSGKNLAFADLVDTQLPDALLHKTFLKGADLTLTDLRGATLVQANLTETTLLGTQLQQATCMGRPDFSARNLRAPTCLAPSFLIPFLQAMV